MDQGWEMKEITPACPRCGSSNTKFCYYNNYSLTQPRYFCKGCRRYWTKGGSLRNIPVGGGCRKSRRCNRSSSSSSSASHLRTLNGQHLIGSTNTSMMMMMSNSSPLSSSTTSSTIDLAVVYANFLNPKHRNLNQGKPSASSELLLSGGTDHHHQVVDHEFIINSVNPTFDISSINLGTTTPTTSRCMFNPATMAEADSSSNRELLSDDHHLYLADEHQLILHHHPKRTQFHSYDQEFTPLPNLHTSHGTTTCSNETASRNELINNISLPPLPGEEEHHQDTAIPPAPPPPPFQDNNLQLWDHHSSDNNYGNRDEDDVLQSITNGVTDQEEKMEPTHHQFSYSSFIRDCWNPIDDFSHDVQTSIDSVAGVTSTVTAAVVVTPTTSLL